MKKIDKKYKIIVVLACIIIIASLIIIINKTDTLDRNVTSETSLNHDEWEIITVDGNEYYESVNNWDYEEWTGNYEKTHCYYLPLSSKITQNNLEDTLKVVSYNEYLSMRLQVLKSKIFDEDFYYDDENEDEDNTAVDYFLRGISSIIYYIRSGYSDRSCNYIVYYDCSSTRSNLDLVDCFVEDNKIILVGHEQSGGSTVGMAECFVAIPTSMPVGTEVELKQLLSEWDVEHLQGDGTAEQEDEDGFILYNLFESDSEDRIRSYGYSKDTE
jgi:hypothetical protein